MDLATRKAKEQPTGLRRCGENPVVGAFCACDVDCMDFDDCCEDYKELCDPNSCSGHCGEYLGGVDGYNCQCDHLCVDNGDCCLDWEEECNVCGSPHQGADSSESCGGKSEHGTCWCDKSCSAPENNDCCSDKEAAQCEATCAYNGCGYDAANSCQCDKQCQTFGDCCWADFVEVCFSCGGSNCGSYDANRSCQCDPACRGAGDCCEGGEVFTTDSEGVATEVSAGLSVSHNDCEAN